MSDIQIKMSKSVLRRQLYSIINKLSKNEIARQSENVTKKILMEESFKKAKVVSIYLSMENEIQTENLLEQIFKQGKECFIPRFQTGSPIMEMVQLSSMEQYHALPINNWNIKQPLCNQNIKNVFERGKLDLVLTPGLGFTKKGHRMGRGKGYYDRFFQKCKEELAEFPFLIGLAFKEQILQEIPTEKHDFILDLIISSE